MQRRGFSLPGVMALALFLFTLFLALHSALEVNRHRLALEKYRQSAYWMAVSGAELAQSRWKAGTLKVGSSLRSPNFHSGHFEVTVRGDGTLVSTGVCGPEKAVVTRGLRL